MDKPPIVDAEFIVVTPAKPVAPFKPKPWWRRIYFELPKTLGGFKL